MGRRGIKLGSYYIMYSTNFESVLSVCSSVESFKELYLEMFGTTSTQDFENELERIERKGCSSFSENLRQTLSGNRAGRNWTHLSALQIYEFYCLNDGNGIQPLGIDLHSEEYDNFKDPTISEDGTKLIINEKEK